MCVRGTEKQTERRKERETEGRKRGEEECVFVYTCSEDCKDKHECVWSTAPY